MSSSKQYILEIEDKTYRYQDGQFNQIDQADQITGAYWLITNFPDMQQSISRVTTVETEPKYARIMAGKKLQEEGEFTEPVHVIKHTLKKKGQNRTELFYTAVTATLFHQYQDKISDSEETILVFPLYKVLLQIIRKMKINHPVALIFRHGRHADLVIASHKITYYANRATSFDTTQNQVESLWNIIQNDLSNVEREQRITIDQCIICNWFDAQDKPDWQDRTISETPSTHVTINGESTNCSLLPLLDLLHIKDSISPSFDTFCAFSKQIIPLTQIIVFLLALGLLAGSTIYQSKTESIKQEIIFSKQKIVDLTQFSVTAKVEYKETLDLLETLNNYRVSKTFKTLINDLSTAISHQMIIEQIIADVQNNVMTIQIRGTIDTGFQNAYQGYQNLIKNLKHNQYIIADSTFNTEIDKADFILTFTSKMGGNK